jgi:hypothetical protein
MRAVQSQYASIASIRQRNLSSQAPHELPKHEIWREKPLRVNRLQSCQPWKKCCTFARAMEESAQKLPLLYPMAFQSITPKGFQMPQIAPKQASAATTGFSPTSAAAKTTQQAQYAANDAQAESEGANYQAAANADAANKTNALAQTLAQARNSTPGGGIRIGIQAGAQSANAASSGLTAANAASRVARKKNLLKTQTDAQAAAQQQATQEAAAAEQRAAWGGSSIGTPIRIW